MTLSGRFVSFRILSTKEYLFIFNSFFIAIGRLDFICKTKFCSLPNFVMCHHLNIWHVSNVCDPSLVELKFCWIGKQHFFMTNLVIIWFIKKILMSINALTSRHITYMPYHVYKMGLEVTLHSSLIFYFYFF